MALSSVIRRWHLRDKIAIKEIARRTKRSRNSTYTDTGGNETDHYVYATGQQLADLDEAGDINAAANLTGFSNSGNSGNCGAGTE